MSLYTRITETTSMTNGTFYHFIILLPIKHIGTTESGIPEKSVRKPAVLHLTIIVFCGDILCIFYYCCISLINVV